MPAWYSHVPGSDFGTRSARVPPFPLLCPQAVRASGPESLAALCSPQGSGAPGGSAAQGPAEPTDQPPSTVGSSGNASASASVTARGFPRARSPRATATRAATKASGGVSCAGAEAGVLSRGLRRALPSTFAGKLPDRPVGPTPGAEHRDLAPVLCKPPGVRALLFPGAPRAGQRPRLALVCARVRPCGGAPLALAAGVPRPQPED